MELLRDDLRQYSPASNLQFNETIRKLQEKGRRIYHFGFGQSPFPVIECASETLKANVGANEYLPSNGIYQLRKAISNFHGNYDDLSVDPDDIVVGPGSKELIFLLLTVFGGDVYVLSPSWTTYKPQIKLSGRTAVEVVTTMGEEWKLTSEIFEKAVNDNSPSAWKLLILCNPDNPTGTAYSAEDFKRLSEIFRRHKVIVLADEIYARLRFDGQHVTLSKFYPEGTILCSGLSKWASAGGWRLGYQIYPPQLRALRDAVTSAASHTYTCASAPVQHAAVTAFSNMEASEDYIRHTTRILAAVAKFCHRELTSAGVKAMLPKAGYYIFPDFEILREPLRQRGIIQCTQMCTALLEEADVAVMAGGPAYLRPLEELTVRLCYVNFDGRRALEESRAIGLLHDLPDDFVQIHCSQMYDGIKALVSWVNKQLQR